MKLSEYKSYDDLPLFLNAAIVAKVLGIAPSSSYELMHEADFPIYSKDWQSAGSPQGEICKVGGAAHEGW